MVAVLPDRSTALSPPRLEIRPGVWLDGRLALWLESLRVLVVADIHWGYAASHRAQGNLLPVWGDDEIAARLHALLRDYAPAELIWLGDSVHTLEGCAPAEAFLASVAVPVTVVSGNHDARWSPAREIVSIRRGEFVLHHGDRVVAVPHGATEVVGHHHPAFLWHDQAGTRLKLPALVASTCRLVLPAFSPWAAGSPWPAAEDETIHAIGTKRFFTVSAGFRQKERFA